MNVRGFEHGIKFSACVFAFWIFLLKLFFFPSGWNLKDLIIDHEVNRGKEETKTTEADTALG